MAEGLNGTLIGTPRAHLAEMGEGETEGVWAGVGLLACNVLLRPLKSVIADARMLTGVCTLAMLSTTTATVAAAISISLNLKTGKTPGPKYKNSRPLRRVCRAPSQRDLRRARYAREAPGTLGHPAAFRPACCAHADLRLFFFFFFSFILFFLSAPRRLKRPCFLR